MSLFGLDEMYNELLLEAKSPEEIKKILQYQFVQGKGVPEEVLDKIFESDPTKKKTYTKWVLMQWATEKNSIISALKMGHISELFKYFQSRANDGLNLLGMPSFDEAISMVPSIVADPVFAPISDSEKDSPKNDFEIVYDSAEWRIAIPHTYEADEKLGMGCRWCTAGAFGNGEYYYNHYSANGPLWVNFDKRKKEVGPMDKREYPYTRYQFCFESGVMGELCDSNDDRINFDYMDVPEEVLEFYRSKNPRYADLLSNSIDNEKIWEEYEGARLERTIYYLPSCHGGPALRLMPYFNEDEPQVTDFDPYELYSDDDYRDSVDGYRYHNGADDIYDKCDGFPMLVMKNGDGYEGTAKLNVYYECMGRYSTIWRACNDASAFGGNEYGKFFVDDCQDYTYFFLGPNLYDLVKKRIPFTDSIEEYTLLDNNTLPVGFRKGLWLQVKYYDGFYGLLYADSTTKKTPLIIKKDRPTNGKYFTIIENENGCYIEGLVRKYWIGENQEDKNKREIEIVNQFDDDNNYLIISYTDENSQRTFYGIYDSIKKEIILDKAVDISDEFGCARVWFDDYQILYDYRKREAATRPFTIGTALNGSRHMLFKHMDTRNDEDTQYLYDAYNEIEHGPFNFIYKCINDGNCVAVTPFGAKNGHFLLYNTDTKEYVKDIEIDDYIRVINDSLSLYKNQEGRIYVLNTNTIKTLCEIKPETPIQRLDKKTCVPSEMIYSYTTPDDKTNIFSAKFGVMLPKDVDYVENISSSDKIFLIEDGKKIYFLHVDMYRIDILPSREGINIENIGDVYARTLRDGRIDNVMLKIKPDMWRMFEVAYSPGSNEITSIKNLYKNGENVTDLNIIKEIQAIFFPNKAQISEQFKNIMKRMNDL